MLNSASDANTFVPATYSQVITVSALADFNGQPLSGTSMASPHVAGAAALYKSTHPSATPAQVKAALQSAGNFTRNDTDDPDPKGAA